MVSTAAFRTRILSAALAGSALVVGFSACTLSFDEADYPRPEVDASGGDADNSGVTYECAGNFLEREIDGELDERFQCPSSCDPIGEDFAACGRMIEIEAGRFRRGPDHDPVSDADERPPGTITIGQFYIDRNEVTADDFAFFCNNGGDCSNGTNDSPVNVFADDPGCTLVDDGGTFSSRGTNLPMNCVTRSAAEAYCNSIGKTLPWENWWEKAARGGCVSESCIDLSESLVYPYGDTYNPASSNGSDAANGDVVAVGSIGAGGSPTGTFDMSGNVAEWVADVYSPCAYRASTEDIRVASCDEASCADCGDLGGGPAYFVTRGGSYESDESELRIANRTPVQSRFDEISPEIGFRCAIRP